MVPVSTTVVEESVRVPVMMVTSSSPVDTAVEVEAGADETTVDKVIGWMLVRSGSSLR